MYKPDGYTGVAPYLVVTGAAGTIDFVGEVFDAIELQRIPDATGRVLHAEVRIDDTVVMLADATDQWPPAPAHVHVYVRDVDDTYARALTAGATAVEAPARRGDRDRRGGVKDAGGTTWWIASRPN